jgi:hypothetical protein
MRSERPATTLRRFFSGIAEHVFHAELGVADPPLVDYISDLICRFVRVEAIYKVRNLEGRSLQEVADMVAEAEHRYGEARRQVHRHIGDFTLFWTGIYPEALRRLRDASRKDYFVDYCAQGKKAYLVASTIETQRDDEPPAEVLEQLSVQFELCAYGLGQVRRQWESDADQEGISGPILIN